MSMKRKAAGPSAGIALLLAVASATLTAPAYGQSDVATKEAEARFKEGLKRHDAGDEEGARLSFLEAFSVLKRPNILFNLARAEQLTGHWVDALTHYKLFVADNNVTGADRETARKRIAELTPLVGHVTVIAPSGADLWIDGQMLPRKAPLSEPADVSAGMHTVQARVGDQTKSVGISCQAGQTVTAKIDIEITGTPVVVVPMPGEGGMPTPPPPPAETPHQYKEVTPGAKVATVVVLGVAAVGLLGAGIGLEAAASSANSTASTDRSAIQKGSSSTSQCLNAATPGCSQLASEASSHVTDSNIATGMFVGAGALAAAAVITWIAWPKKTVETARVTPLVSPTMAGFGFSGSF
jgi:hypothetical protein